MSAFSLVATTGQSSQTRTARDIAPADLLEAAFKAADIVYGQIPLYTDAHNAALASGTRTLMVAQGVETLRRMFPDDDVIKRTYAGAERMWAANEIRVTDDRGSDFGRWIECLPVDVEQGLNVKVTTQHYAETSVRLATRWGRHACYNFFLQHEVHVRDVRTIVEQVKQQRR